MRTKKAMMNMASSMLYQIVAIVCGLITPRLILTTFGSTYNGVVSSATQFLNMISVLTLGITGATRVALYTTLGNKDMLGTSRIMKATKLYMRKVAACIIIYAGVLCVVYPLISRNDLSHIENATLIIIVSIGTFAEYFFGISNTTLLNADQSGYLTYSLNILKTILNTLCVAILIRMGSSIYIVKLGSSIVFLLTPALMEIYVKRKYQLISDCEPDDSGIKGRKAVAYHSIANIIHNNTDVLVLTVFTDAKIISLYTVYYLVVAKIKSLMQVFTSGMEAAFGDMWVKKEIEVMKRNFRAYEYLLFTFTAVVFSCVGTLILPFVSQYTKGVTDINYYRVDVAILFTLSEGMYCIRYPYLTLVQATGNYEATKRGAMFEAASNLLLSVVLVNFIGINGVLIGTLVANLFRTTQYSLFISKHILNRSIMEVIWRFLWVIGCAVLTVPTSLFIQPRLTFLDGWADWALQAVTVFAIAITVAITMSLLFYRKDLLYVLKAGKSMVR